jgi:uncharacterized phage-like protein YoqJ
LIIAFTGHRPQKLGGYVLPNKTYTWVCQELQSLLLELKPESVISGMALGFDQYAAFVAQRLNIPVIAAIPHENQQAIWTIKQQNAYDNLLSKCQKVKLVSLGTYSAHKMQLRNEWMVDSCDLLISCYDGTAGGTRNCVNYAAQIPKPRINLNPRHCAIDLDQRGNPDLFDAALLPTIAPV